ncbi:type I-E CRISPR-associated protein Cas6/Cse3/CasE [Rhodococcus hoagii]|nr:type I-E CRISPR-associated protein Cas6/Cse3/CasE [Prescottella equi]MBM4654112.1 type I-E CRISPR-associated protein Cas6/Cse3/CasE [Prescottella equi]MBM4719586.1 type I-E CRISPR-associated protein Cas6/Cse3/CasE [Prescottella equi]NKR23385.1 type I-E CRISPR-associated protein Cas6/Cse3/CasE [Prescottella equi]NKT56004.1 type I-E CRISPR-associated protein Cas6/Cse3/CasE [Prescottella equi]
MTTLETPTTLALHTSYFTLDARNRIVRDALVDAHLMHRLIMSGWREDLFPGESDPRASLGILYAIAPGTDHRIRVVAQAASVPNWRLDEGILIGGVDQRTRQAPLSGAIAFQLTAAPRKSRPAPPRTETGQRARGKKVPLPVEEREEWGRKALTRAGLDVLTLNVRPAARLESASKSLPPNQRSTPKAVFAHTTVTYTGTARITDTDAHRAALTAGIGPAKAYGCGLLLTRGA